MAPFGKVFIPFFGVSRDGSDSSRSKEREGPKPEKRNEPLTELILLDFILVSALRAPSEKQAVPSRV